MRKLCLLVFLLFATGCVYSRTVHMECPLDPENYIIFIDSCPTPRADKNTALWSGKCQYADHARKVLEVYREAGGKKKTWFFGTQYTGMPKEGFIIPIKAALRCGIPVISASVNGTMSMQEEKKLIAKFTQLGGRYYAAAGNQKVDLDRQRRYPVCYAGVIGVGAKDCRKSGDYSNYGSFVDASECGEYGNSQGTSFSTPRHVARKEG